jgi:hypothetical protein
MVDFFSYTVQKLLLFLYCLEKCIKIVFWAFASSLRSLRSQVKVETVQISLIPIVI